MVYHHPLLQIGAGTVVMAQNFENAFLRTKPSVSAVDREFYLNMKDRLCKARAHPASSSSAPDDTGGAVGGADEDQKR